MKYLRFKKKNVDISGLCGSFLAQFHYFWTFQLLEANSCPTKEHWSYMSIDD